MVQHRARGLGLGRAQLGQARLGGKVVGRHHGQTRRLRQALGSRAYHQHMLAVLLHRARGQHRVAHAAHAGHGTGGQGGTVHHGGVQFVRGIGREHRAMAGVEQRAVLERLHGHAHGVERRAAARQHGLAGAQHLLQRRMVGTLLLGADVAARERAGAAMDGDDGRDGRCGMGHGLHSQALWAAARPAPCSQGSTASVMRAAFCSVPRVCSATALTRASISASTVVSEFAAW